MTGKPLRLLSVGKLKVPFWKDAAAHYSQRINRWRRLECVEVRDGDPALPQAQRNELEGRRLLEALGPQDVPLVLDERGITMTSPQLAQLLQKIDNNAMAAPVSSSAAPTVWTRQYASAPGSSSASAA